MAWTWIKVSNGLVTEQARPLDEYLNEKLAQTYGCTEHEELDHKLNGLIGFTSDLVSLLVANGALTLEELSTLTGDKLTPGD